MRVVSVVFALLFLAVVATAQAPSGQPVGTLAQVMRGILFPNSNLLFDVQTRDPDAPPEAESGGTVTSTFASIYAGWQVVENASVALAEVQHLITMPGRLCENGRPVPVQEADFIKYAQELGEVGRAAFKIAQSKDRDAMIEITNQVAGACENCHVVYRRFEDRCIP